MSKDPRPPEHLSNHAKRLWAELGNRRGVSAGRLQLLVVALESLDRAETARQAVERDGLVNVTKTTGAVHLHPLLKVERESRALFSKIWGDLCLDFDPQTDGRNR